MKKILLTLLLALTFAFSASAIITEPKGTPILYGMDVTGYGWSGNTYTFSKKVLLYVDNNDVYMSCLQNGFDYAKQPTFVKGSIEGDKLIIPSEQVICPGKDAEGEDILLCAMEYNSSKAEWELMENIIFDYTPNEITLTKGIYLCGIYESAIVDINMYGTLGNNYNIKFFKMDAKPTVMPEGLTQETYIYSYTDPNDAPVSRGIKVAFDGDKVYMTGLAPDAQDDCVVGTYKNNRITIQGGQLLDGNPYYYLSVTSSQISASGELVDWYDNITFDVSADKTTMTLADESGLTEYFYGHYEECATLRDVKLVKYTEDKPAKPRNPEIVDFVEGEDNYGPYKCFDLEILSEDIDGNYINPEKLYYRMYKDGNLYTFTTDKYKKLTADMTEIPYLFTDKYDFDIQYNVIRTVYIYDTDWSIMEFDCVYKVDGIETASDRVFYEWLESDIASIKDSMAITSTEFFDLTGRKHAEPVKGNVMVEKTCFTDGTVSTRKVLVK